MSVPPFFDDFPVTQTWEQHIRNAGERLGGVDYVMPVGTPLPGLPGVLEWVTPETPPAARPAWYNTGLGNAAAYRYPDGTRTVYGHCSRVDAGQVFSGNTGRSTGPHVHVHDVLADGRTRTRPFTLTPKPKPLTPDFLEDTMSYKYIWNGISHPNPAARYALLSVHLPGGYIESSQLADAKGFSGMSPNPGAPHQLIDNAAFDQALKYARIAHDHYREILRNP